MPGLDGTGPAGMGPLTGGGRGYCGPGSAYGGVSYGWPRWRPAAYPSYGPVPYGPGAAPYPPAMSREQELDFLKRQADGLKRTLEGIDQRIKEISGE